MQKGVELEESDLLKKEQQRITHREQEPEVSNQAERFRKSIELMGEYSEYMEKYSETMEKWMLLAGMIYRW